jgi:hypothetical protein
MEGKMPSDFTACVNSGGRVRTKTLSCGRYIRICFDKSGKSHSGEVKHVKAKKFVEKK